MSSSIPFPKVVAALENVYGPPTQAGFGSAVFFEQLSPATDLEQAALRYDRYFVGDLWDRYGETVWMSSWKQVYAHPRGQG